MLGLLVEKSSKDLFETAGGACNALDCEAEPRNQTPAIIDKFPCYNLQLQFGEI